MQKLGKTSIGLVLSGGGAKGAYQAGLFGTLAAHGLWERVTAISGSSIGAFNALLATTRDYDRQRRAWERLTLDAVAVNHRPGLSNNPLDYYPDTKRRFAGMTLERYLEAAAPFPFSQELLRVAASDPDAVDAAALSPDAPMQLYCCAYNMGRLCPEYFCLNRYSQPEATELVMASCCIPILLPPVQFAGEYYCDGGLMPPYYTGADNSDKIPLAPLLQSPPELIVVVYLSHHDRLEPGRLPGGATLLELYPSQPLETRPGMGTLDFSPEAKAHHLTLGLADSASLLERLEQLLQAGVSLPLAAQQLNECAQRRRLAVLSAG